MTSPRSLFVRGLLLCGILGLGACDRVPLDSTPPEPLPPRPTSAEQTCEQLASQIPGASWRDLGPLGTDPSPIVVTDPSVFGGPFEDPLRFSFPKPPTLRLLWIGEKDKETILCVQLRTELAPSKERYLLGRVGVDTDMLLLGYEQPLTHHLTPSTALVTPCAEGPGEDLEKLQQHLGTVGEQLVSILPTLICLNRPATPEDQLRIVTAFRDIRGEGRYLLEPRSAAWPLLQMLGAQAWALFPNKDGPLGVILDVKGPEGAYPVFAEGKGSVLTLVEILLL